MAKGKKKKSKKQRYKDLWAKTGERKR